MKGAPLEAAAAARAPQRRTLQAEIAALMQDFSLEKTPGEVALLRSLPADLPRGSRVYITWITGNDFTRTLSAAVRLRELGMQPVPHLAARAIAHVEALEIMLAALHREAGVDHALLVAGSARNALGRFDSTLAALATGQIERHGFRALGVAGHPEGSPDIAPDALTQALRDKNEYALRSTLRLHLVTQFCFEAAPVVAWERQARASGNRLPVHVGLAGLASVPTLIKYARHCGVGASLGTLTRQAARVFKLSAGVAPGEVVVALAAARLAEPAGLISQLHFYPFGAFDATVAWAAAVARGDFRLIRDDRDIAV